MMAPGVFINLKRKAGWGTGDRTMKMRIAGFFIAFFSMTGLCYAPHYTTFGESEQPGGGTQAEDPSEPRPHLSGEGERFTSHAPAGEKMDQSHLPQEHAERAPGNARRERP